MTDANTFFRFLHTVGRPLWAGLLALWLVCAAAMPAHAEGIELRETRLEWLDNGWNLRVAGDFELSPALVDAVNKGVALYFVTDFELYRNRWYWFDDKVLSAQYSVRLSYQPLTRQYFVGPRTSSGGLQQRFSTLKEALGMVKRISYWRVVERGALPANEPYQAAVRMRLDVSQLPKPFQVNAVNSADWNLSSDWRRFSVAFNEPRK